MVRFPSGTRMVTFGKSRNSTEALVAFTIKNGKPFDPTEVIDLSEDEDMVNLLFSD